MSPRKIIFLVIVGIVAILILLGIWRLSESSTVARITAVKKISLWVVWDTSEQYQNLFADFWTFDKKYAKTEIDIRVFPDYDKYKKILLSTLSEWVGPDIFMVDGGADDILMSKLAPIPDSFISLQDFDKKYEDIFLPLIITEGEKGAQSRSLLWVPLGYETLGLFYHKSLLRSVPRTWNEVQNMYNEPEKSNVFPINIGLGPLYTPYTTDIIAYFMGKSGITETKDLTSWSSGVSEYLKYASTSLSSFINENGGSEWGWSLQDTREEMDRELLSTIDLFMRGRIAILVWYPSLIREIEKAEKRAWGDALDDLILTEKLPQDSLGKNRTNIARYRYLGVSKKTENAEAAAALLSYTMSDTGRIRTEENFPLLISPVRSWSEWQKETPLSKVFTRTRLDAFIPELQDTVFVFGYGIKWEYERVFREYIDRNEKIDINKMLLTLSNGIWCELDSILSATLSEKCTDSTP